MNMDNQQPQQPDQVLLYLTTFHRPAPMDNDPPIIVHHTLDPSQVIPSLSASYPDEDHHMVKVLVTTQKEAAAAINLRHGGTLVFQVIPVATAKGLIT